MKNFYLCCLSLMLAPCAIHAQDSVIFAREQLAIITVRQEPQAPAPTPTTPADAKKKPEESTPSTFPLSNAQRRAQLESERPDLGKGAALQALWDQAQKEDQAIPDTAPKADIPMKDVRRTFDFIITIQNAQSNAANWIYDATDVHDEFGLLYVFDTPTTTRIDPSENQSAYDIIMISSYGEIRSIAKNIIPSELAEPIEVQRPVKALLYVEGGITNKYDIRVRDKIYHPLFPDRPEVQEE
ncbi:MAG: DUF192 domain-containing protein [Alphaproteobacteria bacterium]|nr:MAG: DUF192 domain-containing protein [Alphaproteobacteria bacterium]